MMSEPLILKKMIHPTTHPHRYINSHITHAYCIYTKTHTNICTLYSYILAPPHAQLLSYTHTHTHTRTHTYTHTRTHTHSHTNAHTHMHTHIHTHVCTHTLIHTNKHT